MQVAAPVAVDTNGIGNWLRDNAVKIVLIVIGLVVLMASRRGDHSRVVSTVGLSLIGLMVLGIAFSGSALGCRVLVGEVVHPEPAAAGRRPACCHSDRWRVGVMRIRTDDELRRVDARWLGPPRVSFPWPATRYVAYGVGFVVFLLVGWLFARFAEVTFWTMLYTLLITIGVTGWICKRIDDERPLSTLPAVLWAELGTPRRSAYDQAAVGDGRRGSG